MPSMRAVVFAVIVATRGLALADEPPPWAAGVTDAQKADAKKLLDQGNARFAEHDYVAALEVFRQAVAAWDHPAIRFNIVRCLIQLDRRLEAADELELALKYGKAPLEESVYADALAYQKLLANEIGHVAVHCTQSGVDVSLDGQHLLACPGNEERRVAPGMHQVVGTRAGYNTEAREVVVIGGKHEEIAIALAPVGQGGKIVHRWSASWMPWLVTGAGLVVAGIGGLVDYQASRDMSSYDRALVTACLDVGCGPSHPLPPSLADQKTSAQRESAIGIGVIGVGVAGAIAGGVLVYMNRGIRMTPEVAPVPGGASIGVSGHF